MSQDNRAGRRTGFAAVGAVSRRPLAVELALCTLLVAGCGGGDIGTPTAGSADLVRAAVREAADPPAPAGTDYVYRFAKISNGAYFYTGNAGERDIILASYPDFRYEGIAFLQLTTGASTPVYRFANLNNGGYFYTGSLAERDATIRDYPHLRYEGTTFSVAQPGAAGSAPVYRLANLGNGAYLYTSQEAERSFAVGLGIWRDEGIGFYAPVSAGGAGPGTNPPDPGTGGGGSNNGCYDLALFDTQGTHSVVTMQILSPVTGTQTIDLLVGGQTTFEGQQAIESIQTNTSTFGGNTTTSEFRSYGRRTGDAEFTTYGSISISRTAVGPLTATTTGKEVLSPPFVDRQYSLSLGGTFTAPRSSSTTTTVSLTGTPDRVTTATDSRTITTKFVARESVTVPAGTYDTCRLDVTTTTAGNGSGSTIWVIFGKGIPVQLAGPASAKATSVVLNGQPL